MKYDQGIIIFAAQTNLLLQNSCILYENNSLQTVAECQFYGSGFQPKIIYSSNQNKL